MQLACSEKALQRSSDRGSLIGLGGGALAGGLIGFGIAGPPGAFFGALWGGSPTGLIGGAILGRKGQANACSAATDAYYGNESYRKANPTTEKP